jgi:murein DD-endopeptidase MepM/ murein hydrolase activator NlpD
VRRHSHFISLSLMLIACIISVREYRKEHAFQYSYDNDMNVVGGIAMSDGSEQFVSTIDPKIATPVNSAGGDVSAQPNASSTPAQPLLVNDVSSTEPRIRTLQISKGDTISSLLSDAGVSKADVDHIFAAIKSKFDVRRLKIGQTLVVTCQNATDTQPFTVLNLELTISNKSVLTVRRNAQGDYVSSVDSVELKPVLKRAIGQIHSSFYSTAIKSGVPVKIVQEAIANLTYVMNFQQGIKRGDKYEILYEEFNDRQGNIVRVGNVRYVGFMAGNVYHRLYRYENNGHVSYYDAKGQSIVRGLLQTPVDASKMRVTSRFGRRMHPLKGYMKDHKGVDLGAPTGTLVKAAGDGVIVKLGYFGDYGHFIKIKHGNGYETAYAHLSRYAKGLTVGSRVTQNQAIGYVGATGSATGPHLHFEVIYKGAHVNPMSVQQMPSVKLVGKDLQKFNSVKHHTDTHLVGLTPGNSFAQLSENAASVQPIIG